MSAFLSKACCLAICQRKTEKERRNKLGKGEREISDEREIKITLKRVKKKVRQADGENKKRRGKGDK